MRKYPLSRIVRSESGHDDDDDEAFTDMSAF